LALFPEFATRDCQHCRKWLYDDKTGDVRTDKRTGDRVPRPAHLPPRCEQRGARPCPRGPWSAPTGFDEATFGIYVAVQQCEAVGQFPPDALLHEFANTIRLAKATVERHKATADRQLQIDLAMFQAKQRQQQ
jgi:hypothetical protein